MTNISREVPIRVTVISDADSMAYNTVQNEDVDGDIKAAKVPEMCTNCA